MTITKYPEKQICNLILKNKWPFPVTDRSNKSLVFCENMRNGKLKETQREIKRELRRQKLILPPALL